MPKRNIARHVIEINASETEQGEAYTIELNGKVLSAIRPEVKFSAFPERHYRLLKHTIGKEKVWYCSPQVVATIISFLDKFLEEDLTEFLGGTCLDVAQLWSYVPFYARSKSAKNFFPSTIVEGFIRRERGRLQRRFNLRKRGGRTAYWTPELRKSFLELYEATLKIVKAGSSELPEGLRSKASLRGIKPSDIAREYAAKLFGVTSNEYLLRVLKQARRERRERGQ
jgi:hypothetical protein